MSDAPPELIKILTSVNAIASAENKCFLVGGILRDFFLCRPTKDIDFAVSNDPKRLAKKVAEKLDGSFLTLKAEREIYRVVTPDEFQLDFAKFKGAAIELDLAQRDFSMNAMALKIDAGYGMRDTSKNIIDPYDGRTDIEKKIVRQISDKIYADDPLRLLRAFRIAAQLGFEIEPETLRTIQKNKEKIQATAKERVREEILLILDCARSYPVIQKIDAARLVSAIFPEVDPNRECARQYYPDKGVWGHSLDGLNCLEWILENLESEFPEDCEKISSLVFEKGKETEGHARSSLMKLAILFHDIGKAPTAEMIDGRMRFFQHEDVGAGITKKIAQRLKFSSDAVNHLSKLVQAHMRPGGLAHAQILTERAKYKFFRDLGISAIPMLIVSLADRYTYLSENERGQGKDLHEKVVKELIRWHYEKKLAEFAQKPKLIDGNILMEKLALEPSPLIGEILKSIEEAQTLGEIHSREDAIQFAEKWLKNSSKTE